MQIPGASEPMMPGATLKIPPAWDPAWEARYSFRQWHRDIMLWAAATDVPLNAQAAAICMRLGGAAKELTKEVDMNVIQNGTVVDIGDGAGPRHLNGVAVIMRGLSRRFAPVDGEQSVRALANVMSFEVRPNESIDEVLSRFEVLMSRASDEANFDVQPQAKAWMLLSGLQLPPEEWMHLLHPLNGKLPTTEAEFGQLLQFVRRRGRVHQHGSIALASSRAKANTRTHTYVTGIADEWSSASSGYLGVVASHRNGTGDAAWPAETVWYEDEGEESSSATDENMAEQDLGTYLAGTPEEMHGDVLWHEYLMARTRWRQYTGKLTRANRRFQRRDKGKGKKGKSKGQSKGGYLNNVFVEDALPEQEQAYMKTNKGKSKGKRRNPRGADGNVMKCHNCGSEEHLVRDCPRNQGPPTRAFLALPPYPMQDRIAAWSADVSELGDDEFEDDWAMDIPEAVWPAYDIRDPMDQLIDSETQCRAAAQMRTGPEADREQKKNTNRAEHVQAIALATSEFHVGQPASSTSRLFFPTYERAAANREPIAAWHAKTTLPDGREGLLVDVGAHDNLCGEQWVKRVEKMLERSNDPVRYETMKKPLSVEGVGNGAQVCRSKVVVPLLLPDGERGTYEAPVISGSGVPGLLGLKALIRNRAVIDCVSMQMYFLGPGDARIGLPPGSKQYELVQAESGHMLLPISSTLRDVGQGRDMRERNATACAAPVEAVGLHLAHGTHAGEAAKAVK
eukprot:6492791-Amphidinium_carterae.2